MLNCPSLKVFIAVSLDGFIAKPGDELDWLMQLQATAPNGEDFGYAAFTAGVDAVEMGRHPFGTVAGFETWLRPAGTGDEARAAAPGMPPKLQEMMQC